MVDTTKTPDDTPGSEPSEDADIVEGEIVADSRTETAAENPWGSGGEDPSKDVSDAKPAPEKTKPSANRKSGGMGWLVQLLLLIIVFLAGMLLYPRIAEELPFLEGPQAAAPTIDPARLDQLDGRLSALEREVSSVRDEVATLPNQTLDAVAVSNPELETAVADLEARLAALEARPAIEDTPGGEALPAAGAPDLTPIETRLAALEVALAEIDATPAAEPGTRDDSPPPPPEVTAADLATLRQQVEGLIDARLSAEASRIDSLLTGLQSGRVDSAASLRSTAALVTATRLVGRLRDGRSYRDQLTTLQDLTGDATVGGSLSPTADRGIASMAELTRRFDRLPSAIKQADLESRDGFFSQLLARLALLFTIRRIDNTDGEPTTLDARLAAAEAALADQDLEGAVSHLEGLSAGAQAPAHAWLDDARARIAALKRGDALLEGLIAQSRAGEQAP